MLPACSESDAQQPKETVIELQPLNLELSGSEPEP